MAAEEILPLFDLFWFQSAVFTGKPLLPTRFESPENRLQSPVMQVVKVRSQSEYPLSSNFAPPETVYYSANQKLQPILSGKVTEFAGEEEGKPAKKKPEGSEKERRRKRGRGLSKSLSDLEFEELKGFMDLGFVFSEEDKKNSSLASIIPGLQRLGKKTEEEEGIESGVSRPYLSEAWKAVEEEEEKRSLMKWRVPDLGATEMDMKDHLKFWAHTVASTVR
ncbi:uncharacterized protein LOC111811624 [Cucurbita pepo subsp. pepo]|uniref:uncharacterized protein LOC111811624 n=1 Tax=Cucurbita pepo subsp. pepo TaxID=3664 RepID=UPI000C9DA137|nr:uncharacterized protein LOC111811624 [Cucurbita pepo subsp. pepo]